MKDYLLLLRDLAFMFAIFVGFALVMYGLLTIVTGQPCR